MVALFTINCLTASHTHFPLGLLLVIYAFIKPNQIVMLMDENWLIRLEYTAGCYFRNRL